MTCNTWTVSVFETELCIARRPTKLVLCRVLRAARLVATSGQSGLEDRMLCFAIHRRSRPLQPGTSPRKHLGSLQNLNHQAVKKSMRCDFGSHACQVTLNIHTPRKTLPEPLRSISKRRMHRTPNLKMRVKEIDIRGRNEAHRSRPEVRFAHPRRCVAFRNDLLTSVTSSGRAGTREGEGIGLTLSSLLSGSAGWTGSGCRAP